MTKRGKVQPLMGISVLTIVVLLIPILVNGYQIGRPARAETLQMPPTIDGTSLITPTIDDFPDDMAARIRLPRRSAGSYLVPVHVGRVHVEKAIGAGYAGGPSWADTSTVSPGGGVSDRFWSALSRYVVYETPEDAQAYWRKEDSDRQVACGGGSFSGEKIGDWCGHLSAPGGGIYELHVIRANVSVNLQARVMLSTKAKDGMSIEAYKTDVEEALEATAKAIVRRIDGVVKAKGRVDMSNLPPVKEIPG